MSRMSRTDHRTEPSEPAGRAGRIQHPGGAARRATPTRPPSSGARSRRTSCSAKRASRSIEANADRMLADVGIEIHDDAEALQLFRDAGATVDGVTGALRPGPRAGAVRHRAAPVHPAGPQPGSVGGDRRRRTSCLRPPTARRSCATSPTAAATPRWTTSRTSSSWPTSRRGCTTRAARCASPSTCPSTSATSTWCTPTCATATRRSWDRSPQPERAADSIEMARIAFGADVVEQQLRHPGQRQRQLAAGVGRHDDRRAEDLRRRQPGAGRRAVHPRRRHGARSPLAGAVAQAHAETLVGVALGQLVAPGLAGHLRQLPVVDGAAQSGSRPSARPSPRSARSSSASWPAGSVCRCVARARSPRRRCPTARR